VAIARSWRAAKPVLSLVGTDGFVFLALSAISAITWLSDPANGHQQRPFVVDDLSNLLGSSDHTRSDEDWIDRWRASRMTGSPSSELSRIWLDRETDVEIAPSAHRDA
jgi:hypothetical protein